MKPYVICVLDDIHESVMFAPTTWLLTKVRGVTKIHTKKKKKVKNRCQVTEKPSYDLHTFLYITYKDSSLIYDV
jgi:hypothetical protein